MKDLTRELKRSNFFVDEIHSDLIQDARERVLASFTNGRLKILVATDILSRGIHIDNIDLVINYDVPNDGEDYVHRVGRTARAEAEGKAFTLINEREQRKFFAIESLIGTTVDKGIIPEQLGATPKYDGDTRPDKKRSYSRQPDRINRSN